jgi:acyl-CoA synthetase (AMP-forming)/AMP-acid ligase II
MSFTETSQKTDQRVGIVAANHTGYVEALLSCLESGTIAVPLRHSEDFDRIKAAGVEEIITPEMGDTWMMRSFQNLDRKETALISFTSGTEGAPKGVMLTHRNLADVIHRLNTVMQVDDSISEYIGVPVYHSFGFGRCRAVASAGGRFFIPSNGFNPSEIGAMLKNGEINAISAVPSLWRVLLANRDLIGTSGRRVRWIEIGSQYMSQQEKEALKTLFPEARIVQHYGLTEASRSTLLEVHTAEGEALESVGKALGGVEIRLTPAGQIAIRGNHVASQYLINGTAIDIADDDGWFLTKDLGSLKNGDLYYEGRADDIINCGGIKVHPEALETKVYASIGYGGQGLAICRKSDPIRGEGFLVALTKDANLDLQQIREAVLQATQTYGINAANAISIVEVEQLPKTATGKIQRKQLSAWYAEQEPIAEPALADRPSNDHDLQSLFCRVLNLHQVTPEDTFISLGGDSLSYVQLAMELERHLGYLPQNWEHDSIAELEALTPQRRRYITIETNVFLRGLAIAGVVADHAGLTPMLPGGATLLMMIAGANLARFQADALFQGRFVQPIFSLLRNLLIPYWVVTIAYQVWRREPNPFILLQVSNLISVDENSIFPVWFINVLVQIILIFSLLFSAKVVQKFAKSAPWTFGGLISVLGVVVCVLMPLVWDTTYLYNRVPHMLFWVFTLGWMIHFAESKGQRMATTGLIAAIATCSSLLGIVPSEGGWLVLGSMLLIWLPNLSIPQVLKSPLQIVGASAYYIYLYHMIFIHVVKNVAHIENPWLNTIAGLLGGVLVWLGLQATQPLLTKWRQKKGSIHSG